MPLDLNLPLLADVDAAAAAAEYTVFLMRSIARWLSSADQSDWLKAALNCMKSSMGRPPNSSSVKEARAGAGRGSDEQ